MLERILGYTVVAVTAWWAWTGPIHDWRSVSADEQMQAWSESMAHCLRGKEYVAGAGGTSTTDPEAACARELNLYRHEGRWYSYAAARPAAASHRS